MIQFYSWMCMKFYFLWVKMVEKVYKCQGSLWEIHCNNRHRNQSKTIELWYGLGWKGQNQRITEYSKLEGIKSNPGL